MRWGILGVFLLLTGLFRALMGDPPTAGEWPHYLRGITLLLGLVILAPMPWQWTGDTRRKAPFLHGLAQALAWNTVWLTLMLLAFALSRSPGDLRISATSHPAAVAFFRHVHQLIGHHRVLFFYPLLGLMPVALLLGWFLATLQAAEGDRAEAVAARATLETTARQAQEQALKSQLDPHVLYNALSGISELIHEDSAKAEEALAHLGDLYRQLTAFGARESVSLAEERTLVEHYLSVEQIRLGARLRTQWEWPEDLNHRVVPPLLLQPLVENALKHGLSPHKQGGTLRIRVETDGAGLRFTVANDGAPLNASWQEGTGLSNLSARLALLGKGSGLALRQEGPWTIAELRLTPGERP